MKKKKKNMLAAEHGKSKAFQFFMESGFII